MDTQKHLLNHGVMEDVRLVSNRRLSVSPFVFQKNEVPDSFKVFLGLWHLAVMVAAHILIFNRSTGQPIIANA